jgi:hypothetical protein
MKTVELYARVRHAVLIEGISERAAADRFGINARTVSKMLKFSVPPGYVRRKPPFRPKLDEFTGVIDEILATDRDRPKKQRHTSKQIFERLRDEHGFTGKITIVKDYVAGWCQRTQEMFVPLVHPPGHAQADYGEAIGVIGGVECKIHFFAMGVCTENLNPNVLMMKSAQDSVRTYDAGSLNRPRNRRIFVQRSMRSDAVVIIGVRFQNPAQMLLAEDNEVIQTLTPDRSDQPFGKAILPR